MRKQYEEEYAKVVGIRVEDIEKLGIDAGNDPISLNEPNETFHKFLKEKSKKVTNNRTAIIP